MRPRQRRLPLAWPLIVAVAFVGPCRAATPGDPFEGFNRKMFGIEEALDRHLFGPVSKGYRSTPSTIRSALRNWARNVGEPVVFVNDLLQGHIGTAAGTLTRFAVNSTFGVAGFMDVAKKNHLPRHDNSFGTTLGRWGVGPGPYLFLPLVGPTTVRDGVGNLADIGLDPFNYVRFDGRTEIEIASTVIEGISDRVEGAEDLERIRQTSTDPYATLRSYFLQNRQAEVTGKPVDIDTLPDFDAAPPKAAPSPTPAPPTATPSTSPSSASESSTAAAEGSATADGTPDAAPDDSAGEDPAA